jgi:hypothetical protein
MPENHIIIDEKGNIQVDFYGYEGETCLKVEQKLKEALEELGLQVEVRSSKPKSSAQIQEELTQAQSHRQKQGSKLRV